MKKFHPFSPIFPPLKSFAVQRLGTSWDPIWHQTESASLTIQTHIAWHWSEPRPDPFHWQRGRGRQQATQLVDVKCMCACWHQNTHSHKTGLNRHSYVAHERLTWPHSEPESLINLSADANIPGKAVKKKLKSALSPHRSRVETSLSNKPYSDR